MKVKLVYPKILNSSNCPLKQCVIFEKLDGTNIHFVFIGGEFVAFGTRRDCFSNSPYGRHLFEQNHHELKNILDNDKLIISLCLFINESKKYKSGKVTLFFEYYGEKSFAGQHNSDDDTRQLYLIDAQIGNQLLSPYEFIEDFKEFSNYIPKVLYKGKYTGQIFNDVRNGKYNVKEGVIVKGIYKDNVYMVKIKTEEYLEKLKKKFKDNWKNYWE